MTRSYRRLVLLSLLILMIAVVSTYGRCIQNRFVDWDDRNEIYENPHLNPVTTTGVMWNWTHTQLTLYMPVTYMVWGGIAAVAPRDAAGVLQPAFFHAFNLLLHAICSILVLFLLRQLFQHDIAALAGAMLFAIHPLQTEAVCWASGMYTILSAAVSLAALILYVAASKGDMPNLPLADEKFGNEECPPYGSAARNGDGPRFPITDEKSENGVRPRFWAGRWFFWLATLLYGVALLTKAASVSLPLVAGVIDLFVLRRPLQRVVRSLSVWVILAIPVVLLAKSFQDMSNVPMPPWWGRPVVALDAAGFYLTKIAIPRGLIPDYGRNPEWVMHHPAAVGISAAIAIFALVIAWMCRQRAVWITTGIGVFFAGVFPYLGLTTFDFQYVSTTADRYAYFGMVGIAMLACGAVARERNAAMPLLVACCAWGMMSYRQVSLWRDTDTLFAHTLAVNPRSLVSHNVLGFEAARAGRPLEAEQWYRGALDIWPADATIWFNLGNLHLENDPALAAKEYQRAIYFLPKNPSFHKNLGTALAKVGNPVAAIEQYRQAINLDPGDPDTHYNLAIVLDTYGDTAGAARECRIVLQLNPQHAGALMHLKGFRSK